MDGVQRNFSMMAEKIDRMRCLRERCDSYVRLIKLTLDESIREQNSLLDGSAIHNRLKYLGLVDRPTQSASGGHRVDDKARPTSLDFVDKYKTSYLQMFDGFDDGRGSGFRPQPCKAIEPVSYSAGLDDTSYGGDHCKPLVHRFSSAVYDDRKNANRAPTACKYAETVRFRSPQEYRVYCFPTSVPTAQYSRQTAGRFYRRKPVEQYAQEEAPGWGPRHRPEPVTVVEPEPFYGRGYRNRTAINGRRVDGKNDDRCWGDDPWSPEIPSRYLSANRGYAPHNYYGDYYDYRDADSGRRPFSGLTRPCSPVYALQQYCSDRPPHYPGDSGSLLEKKIRDYVWSPQREERIENHAVPYCSENGTYRRRPDFKPTPRDCSRRGDEWLQTKWRGQNETPEENACKRNPVVASPAEKSLTDGVPRTQKNDDRQTERPTYEKKSEAPVRLAKRISFDLDNEDVQLSDRKHSVGCSKYIDDDFTMNADGKSNMAGKDANAKIDNTRRPSILSNNDYSMSKRRDLSGDSSARDSRRPSVSGREKLASVGNSFESEKYPDLKNNFDGNDSLEKNVHAYNYSDVEKVYDGHDDTTSVLNTQDDQNQNTFNDFPIETTSPSCDSSGRKLSEATENVDYVNRAENVSNQSSDIDVTKRRESHGDSIKENAPVGRKNSIITDDIHDGVYKDRDENELSENVTNSPMENRNNGYDVDYSLQDESNDLSTKPDAVNAIARNGSETVSAADEQNNYYADDKLMSAGHDETITTDGRGFAGDNVVQDDYFYRNSADVDRNPTENRYGTATDSRRTDENNYYQNAADSTEERPESQYVADNRGEPYAAIGDDYHYRDRPREENPDDPADYRGNGYESQRPRVDGHYDYYDYQNATGQPAEYAEPHTNLVDQTAAVGHDEYYYRNDVGPNEPSDGNYYGDRGYRDASDERSLPSDQQRYGAVDDGYYGYREPDGSYGETTAAAEELQDPYYPEARPDNSGYEPPLDGYDERNGYYLSQNANDEVHRGYPADNEAHRGYPADNEAHRGYPADNEGHHDYPADNEGHHGYPANGDTEDGQSTGETANQLRSEKQ